jgi:pyrroline-5-carboxylate reductase
MADPLLPGPLWLVGCGNMAGAMLEGWVASGADSSHITVIRPSGRPAPHGVRTITGYPEDELPALVMLGMKPYQIDEVAPELAPILKPETILISILAGVELESHRDRFPAPRTIIRAMPNTPVKLGKGVVGLYSDSRDLSARALVTGLMAVLGHAEWMEDEDMFSIVASLSGSGPAFLYRFIDALAEAAVSLGVPTDQAHRLAKQTVAGAAALAVESGESPDRLADRVASPGGSTRAGLNVLDDEDGLKRLLLRTLVASRNRTLEMAAEARR